MVENRQRGLQINLRARNLSAQAFTQVQRSLSRIRDAGREAMGGLARGAASAKGQLLGIVAAVGGVQKLIIEPAKFEEALTRITLAGADFEDKIRDIQKVIEDLAVSTGTSRDELATGFDAAAKRVGTFEDAVGLLTTAQKLSATASIELESSVTGLSAVLRTYGDEVESLDQVAAQLFATTQQLPQSADAVVDGIGKIAPQAKEAGLGFEGLVASIAQVEQAGGKGSEALTALRTILDQMLRPSTALQEIMDRAGVASGSFALKGTTLGEVLSRIQVAAKRAGSNLSELGFSGESASIAFQLAENGGRDLQGVIDSISGTSIPEFERAFGRVNATTASSIDAFRELSKVVSTAFSGGFLSDVNSGLSAANRDVEKVRLLAEEAGLEFRKWVEQIKPVIDGVQILFSGLDLAIDLMKTGFESIGIAGEAGFVSVKLAALGVAKDITEAYNDVANGIIDTLARISPALFGDTAAELDSLSKQIDALRTRGNAISSELLGDLRSARATGDPERIQIAQEEISDPDSLNRRILDRIQSELEDLTKARRELLDSIADTGDRVGSLRFDISADTSGLDATIAESLSRLQALEQPVIDSLGELQDEAADRFAQNALDVQNRWSDLQNQLETGSATIDQIERKITALQARRIILDLPEFPVQGPLEEGAEGPIPATTPLDLGSPSDPVSNSSGEFSGAIAGAERLIEAVELARETVEGLDELEAAELQASFEEAADAAKAAAQETAQSLQEIRDAFTSGLAQSLADVVTGAATAKEAFRDFANSVIRDIARIAAQQIATSIFGSGAAAADGGVLPSAQAAGGGVLPVVPFADGGPMSKLGPGAGGGTAGSDRRSRFRAPAALRDQLEGDGGGSPNRVLGLLAEAGMPEAVVPLQESGTVPISIVDGEPVVTLPNGGSLPVQITGKGVTDAQARDTLMQSLESDGPKSAQLGGGGGFSGVLRRPTLGVIPDNGPELAAIPLPRGESIPLEVDSEGVARVTLPKGRSLPAAGPGAGGAPGPRPEVPVTPFADGGMVRKQIQKAGGGSLGLFAEAGMPEALVPLEGGSVPLAIENGAPVVTVPGGRSIPVEIAGEGIPADEARAALMDRIGGGDAAAVAQIPAAAIRPEEGSKPSSGVSLSVTADGGATVTLPTGSSLPEPIQQEMARFSRAESPTIDERAPARPDTPPKVGAAAPEIPPVPAEARPELPGQIRTDREFSELTSANQNRSELTRTDQDRSGIPPVPAGARPELPGQIRADREFSELTSANQNRSELTRTDQDRSGIPPVPAGARPELPGLDSVSVASRSRFSPVRPFADGGAIEGLREQIQKAGGGGGGSLGLFAEAGMPEAIVPLERSSVPISLDSSGDPVVSIPGGKSVPVRVSGKGISDAEALASIRDQIGEAGGGSAPVRVGAPGGPIGILREPTIGRIDGLDQGMAAIPLPEGEAIPLEVDAAGVARVSLPKGRSLPALPESSGIPDVAAFEYGGTMGRVSAAQMQAMQSSAAISPIRGSRTATPQVFNATPLPGANPQSIFNIKFSALDGPGVERVLGTPEGRRAIESVFRNARATRRDF